MATGSTRKPEAKTLPLSVPSMTLQPHVCPTEPPHTLSSPHPSAPPAPPPHSAFLPTHLPPAPPPMLSREPKAAGSCSAATLAPSPVYTRIFPTHMTPLCSSEIFYSSAVSPDRKGRGRMGMRFPYNTGPRGLGGMFQKHVYTKGGGSHLSQPHTQRSGRFSVAPGAVGWG